MDSQTQLLIASVVINVLMIIERILSKTKKSKCCGSEIEMNTSIQSSYTPPKEIDLKDISITDNRKI